MGAASYITIVAGPLVHLRLLDISPAGISPGPRSALMVSQICTFTALGVGGRLFASEAQAIKAGVRIGEWTAKYGTFW